MAYVRRYPGGFVDYPDESTPVDAQFLNGVENALISGGAGGGGDLSYEHDQLSAATTWSVTHNLGKFPSVSVVDTGGNELLVDVDYIDANHCVLTLGAATSGKAYLN
jgi:hypothetical protein